MPISVTGPAALGSELPDLELDDAEGSAHRLHSLLGDGPSVVAFLCNHCPYVQHIEEAFGAVAAAYAERGVTTIAVCSNDLENYPQDGPDGIRDQASRAGWSFPYLLDREHALALALGAACTPDLFVYDTARRLVHRGGFDGSTPGNGRPLTGSDLRSALDAVLAGDPPPAGLAPSLGCGIKWAEGFAPE